jgi:RecA-family ATPase
MTNQVTSFRELLDTTYPVTLFEGRQKPQGKALEPSYRKFLSKISSMIVTENKNTVLMTPCRLKNGYRKDDNVLEINQLFFDIDDSQGKTFEDLTELISQFAGVIHTTFSHEETNPRYRIALPLSRPVLAHEWVRIRENFLLFNPEINKLIDHACKEPSRAFYLFSAPPERVSSANFFVSMGIPIDPDHFSPNYLDLDYKSEPKTHDKLSLGGIKEGSRNSSLASFLGGLINRGLTQQQTILRCLQWNETLQPPLDEKELMATVHSIWRRHLSNPNNGSSAETFQSKINEFTLIPAAALLQERPKPREYLIDSFLPKRIVAGLFAPGGAGKSTFALTTAVSLAGGIDLLDTFRVQVAGTVVILSGEDDKEEMQRRLHRITADLSDSEKTLVGKNLHILDLADQFPLFTEKPSHGEVEMTAVPELVASAIERSIGSVDLIIIDPASRFRGGEENIASDTTRFVQTLQYLRDRLNTTIWVAHHVNKGAKINGANQNNARGSSALIDGIRLGFELNVYERGDAIKLFGDEVADTELLNLRCIKSNYGPSTEPLILQRQSDGTLSLFNQNPADAKRNRLLKLIQESGLTKTQFRDHHAGVKKPLGLSEKSMMAVIRSLVAEGLVNAPERGVMELTTRGMSLVAVDVKMGDNRAGE